MGILSHTKSTVCERKGSSRLRRSHDGEIGPPDPFLIYTHGRNVDIFGGKSRTWPSAVCCFREPNLLGISSA